LPRKLSREHILDYVISNDSSLNKHAKGFKERPDLEECNTLGLGQVEKVVEG
jgi:hypothetical protein